MVYAVGFKHWVELREAEKAPSPHTSTAVRKAKVSRRIWDQRLYVYKTVHEDKDLKLKVITFNGGKVIAAVQQRMFANIVGCKLEEGKVKVIDPAYVKLLLDTDWSSKAINEAKEKGKP